MASLLEKSLVLRADCPNGESRFSMLETIREFATAELTAKAAERTWSTAGSPDSSSLVEPTWPAHGDAYAAC
jgi:hypothetical protein